MSEEQKTAIELIAGERQRQISEEGWTPEHDDSHIFGEISMAASVYAMPAGTRLSFGESNVPLGWPWYESWYKPSPNDRIRELVKAGALIVAEIERLQRKG